MKLPRGDGVDGFSGLHSAWEDGTRVFQRGWRDGPGGHRAVLVVTLAAEHPTPGDLNRLAHEFDLKDDLGDGTWAARPLELLHEHGRTGLVLEDPDGKPLHRLIGSPMEVHLFLRLAISLSRAVGQLHDHGLIHKDIKPANVIIDSATGQVWLTGFGIASRLRRERQLPGPPEFIAGTLAYMAPEQTGRMNRSVDSRSDLYSLGVTFYEMLTGHLPFTAADPMEWVHCHIARNAIQPKERLRSIPTVVSAIVMKLLAKIAEERYQTAAGLQRDLQRCLAEWQSRQRVDEFPLGENDIPDRLLIPEKLYGRSREIDILLASFDRVVSGGSPELVLVSGYSGIGKSAVVDELQKVLVLPRGLYAAGKFDQYKQDIPYATLAQAFQSLVNSLLSKSQAELQEWREVLQKALGPNGRLMVDIVPELKLVIGEQLPVPELSAQDAQRRFHLVFRRFISVFARSEHPLALFLDDLQWLDAATLDLLEDLLIQPDTRHLMLIGAYRSNEVDSTHPFLRKLSAIRNAGARVQEIFLSPLGSEDLAQLIADSLHFAPERIMPLAQLIHDKTAGNPFFAIQFLSELAEEGLLTFDHRTAQWSWDLERIHNKGYTDNVIDLMVGKLNRLPTETQAALRQLACLGNQVKFALLGAVYDGPLQEIHRSLWEAVRMSLILRSEESYSFVHDRVLEAAYSTIPEGTRAEIHLRIGTLLAKNTPSERRDDTIFEIVNQLNRGAHLLATANEREQVAELNMNAGRRAKASTAYASALKYLFAGRALLTEECWKKNHQLIFSIEYLLAECELLTADMGAAEKRLSMLMERARSNHEISIVTRASITLYTALDRSDRAVEVCLEFLKRRGTDWSLHPTRAEALGEYERVWSLLGSRKIEEVIDAPLLTTTDLLDVLDVLIEAVTPALFYDENLSSLLICHLVSLSLEHGNSDASCFAYVWFAIISGPRFGNYKDGFRFGQLGYELVEQRGLTRYQARTYMSFGDIVVPWTRHVRTGRALVRRAFVTASQMGDLTFSAYSCNHLVTNMLAAGDPLAEVQREAENGAEFVKKVGFGLVIDHIAAQLGLIRMLRGSTQKFGTFDHEGFDELQFERHLDTNPALAELKCWYWIRKLQAGFFAEEYIAAIDASSMAQQLLWTSPSQFETAEFCFYSALSHAGCWDRASSDQKQHHLEALLAYHKQLDLWAANCPENFATRSFLAGAEIARIEGRDLVAMRLYEDAIRSARENGFVHNEGVANEVAGRYYLSRGFEKIAYIYLQDARYCYVRWGADGKVRQLVQQYPQLRKDDPLGDPTDTILTRVEQLDMATVLEISKAVSSEIVPEKLIDSIMRTAIEHAGAQRGLLIIAEEGEQRIKAQATVDGASVSVNFLEGPLAATSLPMSIVHYVVRTQESVILDDALTRNQFSADAYIRERHARSVLCFPLLNQARLIGVLYLENNLAPFVFTSSRLVVLKLLASGAAISLENTRLYSVLLKREARVRRLIESNIIGIFIWRFDDHDELVFVEVNDAFLRIIGYSRDDFVSGNLRWKGVTPIEWRDRDEQRLVELRTTGISQQYEKEYFCKDGSRISVVVGAALFEENGDEGVAFVVDLTDQKKAEGAVRESEERYRQVQAELAHLNRIATMGELSASIAHEINQPVAAAVTNATTAWRWLGTEPPNINEARGAIDRVIVNGVRAGEVIGRIRALAKKAPPRADSLQINEAILEVMVLVRGEMVKSDISVRTEFSETLPLIRGDRVQLQQVILNLLINAVEAMRQSSVNFPRRLED